MHLAGSAIAQNVGKLDKFKEWTGWRPRKTKWLLLAGASNPPREINISRRRDRDARSGSFLRGTSCDMNNMERHETVQYNLYNTIRDLKITKAFVKEKITGFFDTCKINDAKPVIYYTGHGEIGTGNWCLEDGTLSIKEIESYLPVGTYYPLIIADCCYSGHWANYCREEDIDDFEVLTASPEFCSAWDTDEGGDFTLWITGKTKRPRTEPLFSAKERSDFPIPDKYKTLKYMDFISSNIKNSSKVVISQTIQNGKISAIFDDHDEFKPRPSISLWEIPTHDDFIQYAGKLRSDNKHIFSLACDDDFGFGIFAIKGFGGDQVVTWTTDTCSKKGHDGGMCCVKKYWDLDYKITACGAINGRFYCVMTKGAKGFEKGKIQTYIKRSSWSDVSDEISKQYKKGKIITGICYSTRKRLYLLVMTKSEEGQSYRWDWDNEYVNDRYDEGQHPTIFFKDPTDEKILLVTTTDNDRNKCVFRKDYPLKD